MKRLNKKGFTLVELLAVIVVMALILTLVGGSIGNSLKNAKTSALQTFGDRIVSAAKEECLTQYLMDNAIVGCAYGTSELSTALGLEAGNYEVSQLIVIQLNNEGVPTLAVGTVYDKSNSGIGYYNVKNKKVESSTTGNAIYSTYAAAGTQTSGAAGA